jgi:hypothetical protein
MCILLGFINERAWKVAASFCKTVIAQEEAAEREREDDALASPLRRRREDEEGALSAPECGLRVEVAFPRAFHRLLNLRITLASPGDLPLAQVPA